MRYLQCGAPPLVSWFVTVYHITIYWIILVCLVTNQCNQQTGAAESIVQWLNRYFFMVSKTTMSKILMVLPMNRIPSAICAEGAPSTKGPRPHEKCVQEELQNDIP